MTESNEVLPLHSEGLGRILRHTLMHPFLMDGPGGRSYIDMYWDFLEEAIDAALLE